MQQSQLVFRGHRASIDCVAALDDNWFVSGSQDGALSLWNSARKRPTGTVARAHRVEGGRGGWIASLAAWPATDLCGMTTQKPIVCQFL